MALVGLGAILASVVALHATTPFPGLAAVPACLGAGLLLQAGRFGARTWVAKALSLPPVVYLGAISYSLYLWHWPILTYLRLGGPDEPHPALMAAGVALSIALSAASLRFIERPFRRRPQGGLSRRALFAAIVGAVAAFAVAGEVLSADEGLRMRASGFVAAADRAEHDLPTTVGCDATVLGGAGRCSFGAARDGPPDVVLLGDSEAEAWEAGVADWALAHGLKGQLVSHAACPPVIGVGERDAYGNVTQCAAQNGQVLDQIVADHRIRYLVLASRWALYDRGPDADHPNDYLTAPNGQRDPAKFRALLAFGLGQAINRVETTRANDLTILVIRPTPEFPLNPPRCAARATMMGRDPTPCLHTSASAIIERQAGAEATLLAIARAHPNVRLLTANARVCDAVTCNAELDGRFIFRDGNHPTATGAKILEPTLFLGVLPAGDGGPPA